MIVTKTLMITAITAILMVGLVSSSPYVFAAQPDPGFLNSENCDIPKNVQTGDKVSCCWKGSDGETYCQTCTWVEGKGYTTCSDKEFQYLDSPPNPPSSSSSGPSAPIQDDGVLEQPDKPNKGSPMKLPNINERTLE